MQALNLKAILLAVSLIGISASAYANPALNGGDQNPSSAIEVYDYSHKGFTTDGAFDHWLSFTVDGFRSEFSATLSGTISGAKAPNDYIQFSAFDLYDAFEGTKIETGTVSNVTAKLAFGGLEAENLVGPGTYWLNIKGSTFTTGNNMAVYSGTIAAAVPEPSTYGMLALGLGLIGFAARGRSKFSA